MQILQVNFDDCIPRWQTFVEQEEDVDKFVKHWLSPSTLSEGRPVIGFMTETCLSDLSTVGFKHFNPMWSFPTTSVYQNWGPVTFGMPTWHLCDDTEHDKEALVSQSPIVVFKSAVVCQALGIIHSRIVLPSSDSKGDKKLEQDLLPKHMEPCIYSSNVQPATLICFEMREPALFYVMIAF